MKEELKLKYLKICYNKDYFYQFIDNWNNFVLSNSNLTKKEKLIRIEDIKEREPKLYQIMLEDINAGLC